ncbi:hypothetical protein [Nocardia sp. NPDC004750]
MGIWSPMVMGSGRGTRLDGGPPRRNPQQGVIADKAYSSAASGLSAAQAIRTVIPERSDQPARRKRKGRHGGRAPDMDRATYERRNAIERAFDKAKH